MQSSVRFDPLIVESELFMYSEGIDIKGLLFESGYVFVDFSILGCAIFWLKSGNFSTLKLNFSST